MLYSLYNNGVAAVNETPRNLEIEGYLLQVKKIGNSVGLILPKELMRGSKLEAQATNFT